MKKISLLILIGLAAGLSQTAPAQKILVKSGSLAPLKNTTLIGVEYDYGNMMVGKYKEAQFLTLTTDEYNKKEPGQGDLWQKKWVSDRAEKFQPRLEGAFNNYCAIMGVDLRLDPGVSGKKKMVFHTTFTEPGLNPGADSPRASISAEVVFYDESGAEIAKVLITDSPGSPVYKLDYDTGTRIRDAYANAGKALAGLILRDGFGKE